MAHRTPGSGLGLEAAFQAHTLGGRLAARQDAEGVLSAGAPATFAVWDAPAVDESLRLPDLEQGTPTCRTTVVRGTTIHPPPEPA